MQILESPEISQKLNFNINEIFYSIQGEGSRVGLPCIFVRLQGCLLRCSWCDTPYALERKEKKELMTGFEIFEKIRHYNCKFLMLTGGEPLEQDDVFEFIKMASDIGYEVVIETNGQVLCDKVDKRAVKIMDFKCPASNMSKKNNFENVNYLNAQDEVKFVISDLDDYNWAKDIIQKYDLENKVSNILFSPVFGKLEADQLAKWILEDSLKVRMQLQIHKFIWHPTTRGV